MNDSTLETDRLVNYDPTHTDANTQIASERLGPDAAQISDEGGKSESFVQHMDNATRKTRYIAALCLFAAGGLITGAAVGSRGPSDEYSATTASPLDRAASESLLNTASGLTGASDANPSEDAATTPIAKEVVKEVKIPDINADESQLALANPAPQLTVPQELGPPKEVTLVLSVGRGDTLMGMLTGAGVDRRNAHEAITALSKVFSPRKLRPGHELHLTLAREEADTSKEPAENRSAVEAGIEAMQLVSLRLPETAIRDVQVSRLDDGAYEAETLEKETVKETSFATGTINSSLYEAAIESGVPAPVLADLIQIFSFDIDFQREIQKGDKFALIYDAVTVEGEIVDTGAIQVAEMTVRGKQNRYYRYKDEHGFWDYFDENGRSVRKALLRTPVDGARLSSRFGKRKHPVLGYTKMHRGVDFAAPTGTPVFAAGDGTVEVAGRNGSFGKYVRIRHNGTYKTAYAHLSRIKVKKGRRVRQGQVIGLIGTTGRSTGPHLHYEVHVNNKQTNPLSVKLPTGKTLTGKILTAFKKHRADLDRQYANLADSFNDVATAAGD